MKTLRLFFSSRCSSGSSAGVVHSLTRYSRYLALLDLDQRTLRCPSYCGSLVGRLADPRTGISRGLTYLLHLEGGLTALAQQALLHTFSPALRRPRGDGGVGGVGAEGKDAATTTTRAPCSSEHDLRVMHFLCDLIKRRHAGRGPPVLRISYNSMQLHRNTYAA